MLVFNTREAHRNQRALPGSSHATAYCQLPAALRDGRLGLFLPISAGLAGLADGDDTRPNQGLGPGS